MKTTRLLLGLIALLVASCLFADTHQPQSPTEQLAALGDQFYLAQAHFDPVSNATLAGDSRFDDQLNINIDPKQRVLEAETFHRIEHQLHAIKREQLNAADLVTYDVLNNLLQLNMGILK